MLNTTRIRLYLTPEQQQILAVQFGCACWVWNLVARAHQRVADARRDHLHQLSRRLVTETQVIVVEDLHVKGMMKNPTLAKDIGDVGWGMVTRFLEYTLWNTRPRARARRSSR